MNAILSDNSITSVYKHLITSLVSVYHEREARRIAGELFYRFRGMDRIALMMNEGGRLSESEILKFHFALKRLIKGEPLQYITGKCDFMGMEFHVNPAVLIPRPETEELVRILIDQFKECKPVVADVGTGSGCIAISLAKFLPGSTVTAIDISSTALDVAKTNATENGVDVNFICADILNDTTVIPEPCDLIVSNPPYIPFAEKLQMNKNVVEHEPHVALFVPDNDPLIFYKALLSAGRTRLTSGGILACEIHENMEKELKALFENDPGKIEFIKDMQEKIRFFIYTKP